MKHFFTRRRKGAKEKIEPKHPRFVGYAVDDAVNAVLDQVLADEAKNLSAFAPLRNTSGTKAQVEPFTQRREGAKRRDSSNGPIPISNLSAFAPVRETSSTQSRKESFSPRRKEDRHLKRPDFSFKS
jgi:hypothetical protein